MKNLFIFILLLFPIISCSKPADVDLTLLDSTVTDAKILNYPELSEEEQKSVGSYAAYFPKDWSDGTTFDPNTAFYVKANIIREQLAIVSSMYSCGSPQPCSENQLKEKVASILAYDNPYMLYGKYKNRWEFDTNSGTMHPTEKFDGHRLIDIKQSNDKQIDEVLIGPLPEKPINLIIRPYDGYQGNYHIRYKLTKDQ